SYPHPVTGSASWTAWTGSAGWWWWTPSPPEAIPPGRSAAALDRLAQARAATDAAIAETIEEAHEKLAADKHAQAEASERAAKSSSKAIATGRGKGNGAKADVEKARDAALSTGNQAHAQAGEEKVPDTPTPAP
ncbi:MAG: hypothetical protein R6U98_00375, partial [Pirellulaceae bacterium]